MTNYEKKLLCQSHQSGIEIGFYPGIFALPSSANRTNLELKWGQGAGVSVQEACQSHQSGIEIPLDGYMALLVIPANRTNLELKFYCLHVEPVSFYCQSHQSGIEIFYYRLRNGGGNLPIAPIWN